MPTILTRYDRMHCKPRTPRFAPGSVTPPTVATPMPHKPYASRPHANFMRIFAMTAAMLSALPSLMMLTIAGDGLVRFLTTGMPLDGLASILGQLGLVLAIAVGWYLLIGYIRIGNGGPHRLGPLGFWILVLAFEGSGFLFSIAGIRAGLGLGVLGVCWFAVTGTTAALAYRAEWLARRNGTRPRDRIEALGPDSRHAHA